MKIDEEVKTKKKQKKEKEGQKRDKERKGNKVQTKKRGSMKRKTKTVCPFCPLAFQVLRSQHFPPSFLADKERKEFTCDLPQLR